MGRDGKHFADTLQDVVRDHAGAVERIQAGRAAQHECGGHPGCLGHPNVGRQAVADQDGVVGRESETIKQRLGHVRGRLAHDRLRGGPGRGLDRGEHRGTVRKIAVRRRAVWVGVGGDDARPGANGTERGDELRVVEIAVPRHDDDVDAGAGGIGIPHRKDGEAVLAQGLLDQGFADRQDPRTGGVPAQIPAKGVRR